MSPSIHQVRKTEFALTWYLRTHYGTASDQGVTQAFARADKVGAFAIDPAAVARRDPAHLYRLLTAVVMFQRRQDNQIVRILQGIAPSDAAELASPARLLGLADEGPCAHARSLDGLRTRCDLTKTPRTKRGTCRANRDADCHLKRHTVLLRRYGHFGKVPTSIALTIREAGAEDLADLLDRTTRSADAPNARARAMVAALSSAWRVNEKIAAMFLSMVWNPDLTPGVRARRDLDWRHFVVIDSNTDAFLTAIGYRGPKAYEARRAFLRALSSRIDLSALRPGLRRDNPRIVQQAMYLFMSASNRRAIPGDCMHAGPRACAACPKPLAAICPVRATSATSATRRRLPVIA